jgi:hypothetical protein
MLLNTAVTNKEKSSMSINLKKFNLETKQGKLFKALVLDRETLTEAQMTKRFGLKNPTAQISTIRQRGFAIYAKRRVAGNGHEVTEYRHGEASRKMVAEYYLLKSKVAEMGSNA